MNYEALLSVAGERTVRAGLVGAGDFGASLLAQARQIPNLEIALVCDTDQRRIDDALAASGTDPACVVAVETMEDADGVQLDVLVEATGNPAAAAANGERAIARGQHVVMVSKEAAIVVGPILHRMAAEQGLVYTEVEGDQPSLLIGLVSWARALGLDVRAAGKSSEYDFIVEDGDTLNWRGQRFADSGLMELWTRDGESWHHLVDRREAAARKAGVPVRTVPDFCEMGVVANATGFLPDAAGFHAPLLRPTELADALQRVEEGGLLEGDGRIDVFNCLRRADEASFAGGVFVVVSCEYKKTWKLLAEKGHVVSADTETAVLYNPQHLLGIEAPITILSAALLGLPTGAADPRPVVDLVARTARDFSAGEVLAITDHHHHEVGGLCPELIPAVALGDGAPCPYYLAVGRRLRLDVPAGTLLTAGMVDIDADSPLVRLRKRQDVHFGV